MKENDMENTVQHKKEGWDWSKHKPNNMFKIDTSSDLDFFKWWCTLMHPFVQLTPREIDVTSSFLKYRFELSQQSSSEISDILLMGKGIRRKILADCHITPQNLYVIMSSLKKKGIFTDTGINPRIVPNIKKDSNGTFQLLILINRNAPQEL